ncbi:TetR family transcriptional regulator [Compostimonas suwonensis]|uniref:TetR family transcriptional regulator n=1 Tax=Compostimonas suwonensis TaxID=1048394 RepID=UPI0014760B71|nr:TetR family transcriptional regulator [Compostimonas suwonensis]
MAQSTTPARGRPRLSSREMLEDAAFELFLEQGYAKTTIEQITQRAGVSRNTFFNYFPAKSDVFWVALDEVGARLRRELSAVPDDAPVMAGTRTAFLTVADGFGPGAVPWILTQYEAIGGNNEVQVSAVSRFVALASVVRFHLASRLDLPSTHPEVLAAAYALTAATIAAAQAWAAAGVTRGALTPYLDRALAPVCDGFERAFVL